MKLWEDPHAWFLPYMSIHMIQLLLIKALSELIHTVTQRGQWEMRVDYQRNNKTWSYLHYNQFSVGSASEAYPLTVEGFTGVGTDWFNYQSRPLNGMKFKSGWWYSSGYAININHQPPFVGGNVLFSEMKIRPKDCITQ